MTEEINVTIMAFHSFHRQCFHSACDIVQVYAIILRTVSWQAESVKQGLANCPQLLDTLYKAIQILLDMFEEHIAQLRPKFFDTLQILIYFYCPYAGGEEFTLLLVSLSVRRVLFKLVPVTENMPSIFKFIQ